VGDHVSLMVLLKGLPTGYNRDLQHDKAAIFRQTDVLDTVLPAICGAVETMSVDEAAVQGALTAELLATDAADHLVAGGVPFRKSHEIVGRLVKLAETRGVELDALTDEEVESVHAGLAGWSRGEEAHRRSVDRVRAEVARRTRETRFSTETVSTSTEDHAMLRVESRHVRQAIDSLPSDRRRCIELAYFGGLTFRQVAEQLDLPEGTVKTRIRSALQELRHAT